MIAGTSIAQLDKINKRLQASQTENPKANDHFYLSSQHGRTCDDNHL